jgi:hypothetical protein
MLVMERIPRTGPSLNVHGIKNPSLYVKKDINRVNI